MNLWFAFWPRVIAWYYACVCVSLEETILCMCMYFARRNHWVSLDGWISSIFSWLHPELYGTLGKKKILGYTLGFEHESRYYAVHVVLQMEDLYHQAWSPLFDMPIIKRTIVLTISCLHSNLFCFLFIPYVSMVQNPDHLNW